MQGRFRVDMMIGTAWLFLEIGGPCFGAPIVIALLFVICMRAPDFWRLQYSWSTILMLAIHASAPNKEQTRFHLGLSGVCLGLILGGDYTTTHHVPYTTNHITHTIYCLLYTIDYKLYTVWLSVVL